METAKPGDPPPAIDLDELKAQALPVPGLP
jgi:hypothetical protein